MWYPGRQLNQLNWLSHGIMGGKVSKDVKTGNSNSKITGNNAIGLGQSCTIVPHTIPGLLFS